MNAGSEALIHSMPKRCQAVIDAKGGWTRINGICRYRTSQLNKIFTIVLVALLFSEHSPFELIDFDGGPFHVADTVFCFELICRDASNSGNYNPSAIHPERNNRIAYPIGPFHRTIQILHFRSYHPVFPLLLSTNPSCNLR